MKDDSIKKINVLSVIIPLYNEDRRLFKTFDEVLAFVLSHPDFFSEIIFVDDGSVDKTKLAVEEFINSKLPTAKLISYGVNKGKGYAVRQGMLAAHGEYCLMVDADMSTSLSEFDKFLPEIEKGSELVIGTRKEHGAKLIKKQPWYRQKMGEAYAILAQALTGLPMKDFGCGFKVFSKDAAIKIFSVAFVNRWIFDTEVLLLAKKYAIPVTEIGVAWTNDEDTRVSIVRDVFQSLYDLLRIFFKHRL